MKEYIRQRVENIAKYVLQTHCTVRQASVVFGVSKSTVGYDLSRRLAKINKNLYEEIKSILDFNFSEKHIRGGQSTKLKYQKI